MRNKYNLDLDNFNQETLIYTFKFITNPSFNYIEID